MIVVTIALWCGEGYQDAADPRWLAPALDNLTDCAMVTLSIALIVWFLQDYYAKLHAEMRRRDRQLSDLTRFADATSRRIEAPGVPPPAPTQPLRAVGRTGRGG
jgi:hypothetical protein